MYNHTNILLQDRIHTIKFHKLLIYLECLILPISPFHFNFPDMEIYLDILGSFISA
jgi:hypothetical protein